MKKLLASIMAVVMLISLVPLQVSAEDSVDVSSKLIGQWNFDDQTTNDSAGTNHATLMNNAEAGTATYVDGIKGKALKLSEMGGADKLWLSVPYAAFGDNKDSFTISLWYNATAHNTAGENSELFSLYNSSAEKFLFYGAQMDGNPNAFSMKWDGTYGYANVIGSYKENEWVNLIYCVDNVDGRSKITAYVNGTAVEVDQGGEWANSLMSQLGIDTFTIGGKNPYKGGPTPNCLFYGSVDEVELYAGALNAEEAKAVYEAATKAEEKEEEEITEVTGLIGQWNFDDETTNDSTGTNDATLMNNAEAGTATYVDGIKGKALKLSEMGGADKLWLSVPYAAFGDSKDSFTISLWYNATAHNTAGENSELFSLYNSSAEKFLFYGAQMDGNPNAFSMKWDGTYGYANVIGSYKENEWVNLIYCVDNVDGRSKITAYVNGTAVEVDQGGEWANSLMSQLGIDTFTIGGKNPYKGGATPNCLFYGSVDEIELYDHALDTEEALAVYNSTVNPPVEPNPENPENPEEPETPKPVEVPGLIGYWGFNGTLADSVSSNNAALYDNAETAEPTYVSGVYGQALQLSQQGGAEKLWLSVPYSAFTGHQDSFTISLWYKATGHNTSGENSELFSLYNSSAEKFLFYGAHYDGNANAFSMKWDSTYGYANVIGSYKENEWVNLTYCVSNVDGKSKITAYVNGVAVEVDQGGEWANSLMSQLGIDTFTIGGKNPYKGGTTPNCLFYGLVDEVKLYDHALTAEEALNVYNNALLPYTPEGNPPTGDSTPIVMLGVGMLISAAAIIVCVADKKRRTM